MKKIRQTSWARALSALLALGFLTLTGLAPAQAHDELVSSNPTSGQVLETAPDQLELVYSGDIMELEGANQVRVTDSSGQEIQQGEPKVQGKTLTQRLTASDRADETYTVTWRVVSSDGHPIQGRFSYSTGAGASSSPSASISPSNQADQPAQASSQQGTEILPDLAKWSILLAGVAGISTLIVTLLLKGRRLK